MSDETPETDDASSLNSSAESARALLEKLATAPLAELEASELVEQCSDLLSTYVYGLSESAQSTRDIIISAWTRVGLYTIVIAYSSI